MVLDNSLKISLNKTGLVWRVLVYQILCIVLLCGLALACCFPLVNYMIDSGFMTEVESFISSNLFNFRIDQILIGLQELFDGFLSLISTDISQILYFVLFIAIFVILGSILFGLAEIPLYECVYGYMGSLSRLNFMGYFISNFGRSLKFRLCKLITTVPLDFCIIAIFFLMLKLFTLDGLVALFAPFLIILAMIVLITIRQSLFAEWGANVVVNNMKIWQALKENFKGFKRTFKSVFASTLLTTVIGFAINYGISALTCGVGLLITVPATMIFVIILYSVIYFEYNGLRYYVDKDKIISPRKIEELERIKDVKNII